MTTDRSPASQLPVHKFVYRQGHGENTTLCRQDDGIQTTVSIDSTRVTCALCAGLLTRTNTASQPPEEGSA